MTFRNIATALAMTASLAACGGAGEDQQMGTLLGAVVGGLAGAQVGEGDGQLLAVGVGAVLGALVGGEIGRTMDEMDRQMMAQTTNTALETTTVGTVTEWKNPDTGVTGTVVPLKTFVDPLDANNYCREFQQTVIIGGEEAEAYGTACRQPDGTWQIREA
ncbi:MAG: RT0821/Lpp0805 family surface protein [Proteobacteria bacterium]|nr:RT0821/Lpp0805 family surface protein [Pseudomonadota bacterium]MDA1132897.1 RT0821/Lpp0805 family surface protein [Pseudomonadota bacterium]